MRWYSAPTDTLVDVAATRAHWAARGLEIVPSLPLAVEPNYTAPGESHVRYVEPADAPLDPRAVARMEDVYAKVRDLDDLLDEAREKLREAARRLGGDEPQPSSWTAQAASWGGRIALEAAPKVRQADAEENKDKNEALDGATARGRSAEEGAKGAFSDRADGTEQVVAGGQGGSNDDDASASPNEQTNAYEGASERSTPRSPPPNASPTPAAAQGAQLSPRRLLAVLPAGSARADPEPLRATTQASSASSISPSTSSPPHLRPRLVLDLPCTFFALRTNGSARPLVEEAAAGLFFESRVRSLAERAAPALLREGESYFNAMHLRVEQDAKDWAIILGGPGVIWSLYKTYARAAGMGPPAPLLVASGLASYGADAAWGEATTILANAAGRVARKEDVLTEEDVEGLNPEQLALLDLLILARARTFLGLGCSTFSWFLAEYRTMHGHPPYESLLINATRVGTDDLFRQAATITGRIDLGIERAKPETPKAQEQRTQTGLGESNANTGTESETKATTDQAQEATQLGTATEATQGQATAGEAVAGNPGAAGAADADQAAAAAGVQAAAAETTGAVNAQAANQAATQAAAEAQAVSDDQAAVTAGQNSAVAAQAVEPGAATEAQATTEEARAANSNAAASEALAANAAAAATAAGQIVASGVAAARGATAAAAAEAAAAEQAQAQAAAAAEQAQAAAAAAAAAEAAAGGQTQTTDAAVANAAASNDDLVGMTDLALPNLGAVADGGAAAEATAQEAAGAAAAEAAAQQAATAATVADAGAIDASAAAQAAAEQAEAAEVAEMQAAAALAAAEQAAGDGTTATQATAEQAATAQAAADRATAAQAAAEQAAAAEAAAAEAAVAQGAATDAIEA